MERKKIKFGGMEIEVIEASPETINMLMNNGGAKNDYAKLTKFLEMQKQKGKNCVILPFESVAKLVGCKNSSGSMHNVQRYFHETRKDLGIRVSVKSKLSPPVVVFRW